MKILVLVQNYPNLNGNKALMYVHVRNKYYVKYGIQVDVVNFDAKESYEIDGVKVLTEDMYDKNEKYDYLICHAPNIRNHYRFHKQYGGFFPRFMFFFHGHEVLKLSKEYPKPYAFMGKSIGELVLRDCYDELKFVIWRKYFNKVKDKTRFVFVSHWLENKFFENLKLNRTSFEGRCFVINNSVGETFENESYRPIKPFKFDFITIRSNLDKSTYCVDLLCEIANKYPEYRFLLIGKGRYFEFNKKPNNIDWVNETCNHEELMRYIDQAKCGLMLTRNDTQGVMSCEMATYGIPLLTSDIEICREIFGKYPNVKLISNDVKDIDLNELVDALCKKEERRKLYCFNETIMKEIALIRENDPAIQI